MSNFSWGSLRNAFAGAIILLLAQEDAAAQTVRAARQVLVLQSKDRDSKVFDTFTADLRAALQSREDRPLTLFEFVVAPAGLTAVPVQPVIDFLKSIYADRQAPDLIVTIGGPAAEFARNNRALMFPQTPVVFGAVDERFLGDAPLSENETSVAVTFDYTELIDDILRLLPQTKNVFMVTGSGPLANLWRTELQRDFGRFRDRVTFIWSDDLSYEQMLQRAASLPPHSAIFYFSAGTFAIGSWQGDDRTLSDLSARANAPMFGMQSVWLGAGIVGGRLNDISALGAKTADVVARILDGESPANIRPAPQSLQVARFDARQLVRWKIAEKNLPPGSDVRFRAPSLWRDYRNETLAALAAILMQGVLIAGLLYQRRARHRAEVDSRRSLSLAADANRRLTMSALTGSIAHELSQPLNSILHNAQAGEMMMSSNRAVPETLREILADIRLADVRASEIVERHRLMLRTHELDARPIDIHTVVRDSLALVIADVKQRQVQLDVDLPSVPCVVNGDGVMLQQVVVNLLINAIDAMTGTAVPQRRITLQNVVQQGHVTVSVRDTGTGLPDALDGKLFDPFVTTKTTGMGIGLSIVRTIVEAHRGTIDARNNANGGATFTVTLPCTVASPGR